MKKNLKAILVSTMLAAFAVGGLAACDKHVHSYDNGCDTDCNECGEIRAVNGHVYDNACDFDCNECGEERETPDHVYDNACDTSCNACGDVRAIHHTYDNDCDASCNVCGDERTPSDHVGGTATCTAKAICEECGEAYGALLDHSYTVLVEDGDKHYLACDPCGAEKADSRAFHAYDTWNTEDSEYDYLACACGATDTSVTFKKTVTGARQEFYANATTASIVMDGCSEYASVVSVKLGDISLGDDISALDLSGIKEERQLHGEQNLLVTVLDNGGAEHVISVPVLIVTADISTNAELYLAVYPNESVEATNDYGGNYITSPTVRYGYFKLTKDIDFRVGEVQKTLPYAYFWAANPNNPTSPTVDGAVAGYDQGYFAGTIDGQNYKIITANTTYGTFNSLNGATIKNVVFDDYYYYGSNGWAVLLAHTMKNTTLENVIVKASYKAGSIAVESGNNKGYLVANAFTGNTFKNVTVDFAFSGETYGLAVGSLFGSGMDDTNTFENCALNNCGGMLEFGHNSNTVYDSLTGFEAHVTAVINPEYNKGIAIESTEYEIFLVDPDDPTNESGIPADTVITNVIYNGADLGDSLIIKPSELFTMSDFGTRTLTVKAIYKNNFYYTYLVDIEITSEKQIINKTYTGERKQVILSATGETPSIDVSDITELQGCTVSGISCGTYALGTNVNALTIPQALLEDVANHGNQTINIVAESDSAIVIIEVPVLLVTKGIKTDAEFSEIFAYTAQKSYYGYYVLMNDIGSASYSFNAQSRSTADCEWRDFGFCGTFDGNGHTITGNSASGGLFGWIGNGAVVRNFNVIDTAYSGDQHECVLSRTTADALIEDISFKLVPAQGVAAPTIKEDNLQVIGWLTSHYNINTKFKNITVDLEGYAVKALFGATTYCGYEYASSGRIPVTFENFVVKAENLKCLGYRVEQGVYKYIAVEDAIAGGADITYYTVDAISEANEIKLSEENATLSLGDKYADATVVSIMYGTSNLGDDLTVPTSAFTADDIGLQELVITVKLGKVIAEITVPVTISSGKTVTEASLTDRQDVILDDISETALKASVDLGEYADDGEVISIIYNGNYNLGNDVTNLDVTALAATPKDHGEGNVVVTINKSETEEIKLTVPVTVVTYAITSIHDFWGYRKLSGGVDTGTVKGTTVFLMDKETKNQIYGYYKVMNDIGYYNSGSDLEYVFFRNDGSTLAGSFENATQGFCGTFDGNGKTIIMGSSSRGLFGSLANGAVVKNVKLKDIGYGNGTYVAVFATSIWAATIENVTIDVAYTTNSSGATTAKHAVGYLAHLTSEGATYKNLTVNASTYELVSLFGGENWRGPKNNTFENCVINAKLGALGHKGTEIYSYEGVNGLTVNGPTA